MRRKELVLKVVEVAAAAGRAIVAIERKGNLSVETKADASPVTRADRAAHEVLERDLRALINGVPVLSEESGITEAAMLAMAMKSSRYWLVDPLDGTKDFVSGNGEYAVNVALMEDGVPVVAAVAAPRADVVYAAVYGEGAAVHSAAKTTPLRVPPVDRAALRFLTSRNHAQDEAQVLRHAFPRATFRGCGSSLKYCALASGEADAHVRRGETSLWDVAAPQLVLEEAGGAVLRFDGKVLGYRTGSLRHPGFVAAIDEELARELGALFS